LALRQDSGQYLLLTKDNLYQTLRWQLLQLSPTLQTWNVWVLHFTILILMQIQLLKYIFAGILAPYFT
jgi:hypothetical protein